MTNDDASVAAKCETVDYGPWILQGPREKRRKDEAEPALRLFCIPQAGMGAWAFHGWQKELGSDIEVMPIELPGRNSRMREKRYTSMRELVTAIVDALLGEFRKYPYAILGHSMGAWIAYEVVHELRRRHEPLPIKLYVSANRAPHLCAKHHDVHPVHLHALPFHDFWEAFWHRYGRSKDLESEGMRKYVHPMLKDDFTVLETYQWNGFRTVTQDSLKHWLKVSALPIPIEAFGAKGDTRYTRDQLSDWSDHTSVKFNETWFDGKHRYIVDQPEEVRKYVAYDLFGCMAA